ncbi:MAG: hypothetical protein LBI03_01600, partial [Clostridiales bacterium]|nr:hypothetical protein [Clostridiales bacterium]
MNFFEHLNKEFAYTKEAFLYAINKLSDANSIVINIGISSLSYNTGFLNIRNFKNFIKDVSELINANTKRHIVIVVSDSLEKAKQQYLQPDNSGLSSALDALTQNNNTVGVDSLEKIKQQYLQPHDNLSTSSGLYSALVALAHNDIVNLFYDGFANYNLRVIGFSVSSVGADTTGELNKTLKTIESIVFSGSKTNDVKIRAVRELIKNKKSIAQTSSFNVMTKKTAETL